MKICIKNDYLSLQAFIQLRNLTKKTIFSKPNCPRDNSMTMMSTRAMMRIVTMILAMITMMILVMMTMLKMLVVVVVMVMTFWLCVAADGVAPPLSRAIRSSVAT